MAPSSVVFGLKGRSLEKSEVDFFREVKPWGFLLFGRNCESQEQIRRLTDELRSLTGRANLPVFIDQEGGRVQRLRPPLMPVEPSAAKFGKLFDRCADDGCLAAQCAAQAIGTDLANLGVTVNCAPVLDVAHPQTHRAIGDRAFHHSAEAVVKLGRAAATGLIAGGVLPVIKHMPGHGRATADSHFFLPRVECPQQELAETDFTPFKALADLPMAMTAHVCFDALDAENSATHSFNVVHNVIRSFIGFGGLLITDDICMRALQGTFSERAERAHEAGCDVVLCGSGKMSEMKQVAKGVNRLEGAARERADAVERLIDTCLKKGSNPYAAVEARAQAAYLFRRNGLDYCPAGE